MSLGSVLLETNSFEYDLLQKAHQQVLKTIAFPLPFSFHAEYFINDDNEVILCEIACRTGGACINETNYLIRGVDINLCLLNMLYFKKSEAVNKHNLQRSGGWIVFSFGQAQGKIARIPNSCELPFVLAYQAKYALGENVIPIVSNVQGVSSAVFSAENQTEALLRYQDCYQWFNQNISLVN